MQMLDAHLQRAVRIVGGQTALARACGGGCRQQHVWNWIHRDRRVPAEFVLAIERATGGRVLRHELRPDIYPPEGSGG
jgi:DNA-binding transcriptional regulator YdaS (Cro superfamily)